MNRTKKYFVKIICLLSVLVIVLSYDLVSAQILNHQPDVGEMMFFQNISYSEYIDLYPDAKSPHSVVEIDVFYPAITSEDMIIINNNEINLSDGNKVRGLITGERGSIEWEFPVKESGFYNLYIEYVPVISHDNVIGRGSQAERGIKINGKFPFRESEIIFFERIWKDDIKISGVFNNDYSGNDIKPSQIEVLKENRIVVKDARGLIDEPLKYYLEEGINKIEINSIREPLMFTGMYFSNKENPPVYKEKVSDISEIEIKIQGQEAKFKSSQMLFPRTDISNSYVEPYSLMENRLNYIGGHSWDQPNQWIEWEFEVHTPGLYAIDIKYRQNFKRGLHSIRKIYINNKIIYREFEEVSFPFESNWQIKRISNSENKPVLVNFEKGPNTIRMQNTTGQLAGIANILEQSSDILGEVYRRIFMVVGNQPDEFRDYQIIKKFPELGSILGEQKEIISRQLDEFEKITGQKSSYSAILRRIILHLERLEKDPEQISKKRNIDSLRTHVGALSSWVTEVTEQPLDIDYIKFVSPDMPMQNANPGILRRVWDSISRIAVTYVKDYNLLASDSAKEVITVWAGTGRDQAAIIKNMIDDTFTEDYDIGVHLRLMDPNAVLMQAVIASEAPDVALGIPKAVPVNFALRGAVAKLNEFEEFETVISRFRASAMASYTFDGNVYALPETQTYFMMFYRKDILFELGIRLPETWDELHSVIRRIQRFNLEVGLPDPGLIQADVAFSPFLFQNGGDFYSLRNDISLLDSPNSLNAFRHWTDFYRLYKLPVSYDAPSRFRRGEIPILITEYTFYNVLSVSAPEIRGKWDMVPIPGVINNNREIDISAGSNSQACIIIEQSDKKDSSWKFIKWWTSEEIQTRFGREMESILGPSARYPTANVNSVKNIAWPLESMDNLLKQGDNIKGIPEVPGGYYTPRHLENAFKYVINNNSDSTDTMAEYIDFINLEIKQKRKEFGLDRHND